MIKVIASLATGLVLGSIGIAHAGVESTHEVAAWSTRACSYEDSVNCYWDAQVEGNGRGNSFTVRKFPTAKHSKKVLVCWMFTDKPKFDYCEKMTRGSYSQP